MPPPRLNVLGDKKQFNQRCIEYGAEKAVEEGIIKILDYQKLKLNLDLFNACNQHLEDLPIMDN